MAVTNDGVVFSVALDDGITAPAKKAAVALEDLSAKIQEDTRALRDMQSAMRNLKGGSAVAKTSVDQLKDRIIAQKAVIAQSQEKFFLSGGEFGKFAKKTTAAANVSSVAQQKFAELGLKMADLSQVVNAAGGTSNVFGRSIRQLGVALSSPIAISFALATAMAAVTAAAAAGVIALTRFGLATAAARREEHLRLQGLLTLQESAKTNGQALQDAIDAASDVTSTSREDLSKYALELSKIGLHSSDLERALSAAGMAAQVQGDEGVKAFLKEAKHAKSLGKSVDEVADKYHNKLGSVAAAQMLSLSNQTARLRKNFASLFRGVHIDAFLESVKKIFDMFSGTTATGKALKHLIEGLFGPLLKGAKGMEGIVKPVFYGMLFAALDIEIAFLKLSIAFKKTFNLKIFKNIDTFNALVLAGKVAVFGLAASMAVLAAGAIAVGSGFALAFAPMIIMVGWITALIKGIAKLRDVLSKTDFRVLGKRIVDGLIQGIKGGIAAVNQTIQDLAQGAMDAFRETLKISSPSKVFMQYGGHVTEGFSQGVELSAPRSIEATTSMATGVAGAGANARGGGGVTIGDIHVHVGADTGNAKSIAIAIRDELAAILEGAAMEMGAA